MFKLWSPTFGAPNNEQTKTVNRNVNKPRKIQALAEDETDVDYVPNITKLEYEIDTFGVDFGTQATIGSLMGKRPPSRKKLIENTLATLRIQMYRFEDKLQEIETALEKKRNKWDLDAIPSVDYDDIKQIIMTHIYKKWHLWDQTKAIEPWLSRVVSNQFKNLF